MAKQKSNHAQQSMHPTAPASVDIKKIECIIKKAKTIKITMHRISLPGGSVDDKFVAYMVYKIGDLEASENLVSYKGITFPDSKIISMMKNRAVELNPKAVEKCIREAEEWKKSQTHGHTR